jgi:hypothetical protein
VDYLKQLAHGSASCSKVRQKSLLSLSLPAKMTRAAQVVATIANATVGDAPIIAAATVRQMRPRETNQQSSQLTKPTTKQLIRSNQPSRHQRMTAIRLNRVNARGAVDVVGVGQRPLKMTHQSPIKTLT